MHLKKNETTYQSCLPTAWLILISLLPEESAGAPSLPVRRGVVSWRKLQMNLNPFRPRHVFLRCFGSYLSPQYTHSPLFTPSSSLLDGSKLDHVIGFQRLVVSAWVSARRRCRRKQLAFWSTDWLCFYSFIFFLVEDTKQQPMVEMISRLGLLYRNLLLIIQIQFEK